MLNKVTLIGRLGADPEVRSYADGWRCSEYNIGYEF